MKQEKFELGVEIPKSMQDALLGGQGNEGISITISLSTSSELSSSRDKDSDAEEQSSSTFLPDSSGQVFHP